MWKALIAALIAADTTPDPSAFAQYGIAGALMLFILWLYIDERKEHKALREKVINDVIPAMLANNQQLQESAAAVVMIHQIASRPNLDPVAFARWSATLERTAEVLPEVIRVLNQR